MRLLKTTIAVLTLTGLWWLDAAHAVEQCPVPEFPATLNDNAAEDTGGDFRPQVATDAAGNWVAVWYSNETLGGTIGTDNDIMVSRSTDNGLTWTSAVPLNTNAATDTSSDLRPQITTDGGGIWVVVWYSNDTLGGTIGSDNDIFFARSTNNGTTWSAPAVLNTNADVDLGFDGFPQLTTDGAGNWVTVWESQEDLNGMIDDDDRDILYALSTDGGSSWSFPEVVNSTAFSDALVSDFGIQLTTDGAGNWIAVWASSNTMGGTIGTDTDVLYAKVGTATLLGPGPAPGTTRWGATTVLNSNAATDTGEDFNPQLTTDGAGTWIAAWDSDSDLGLTIGSDFDLLYAVSSDVGATWSAVLPLNGTADKDSHDDRSPQLITDGLGNWVAVWQSEEDINVSPTFDLDNDLDVVVALSTDNGATWTQPISNCCYSNGTPGCDDMACEDVICMDPGDPDPFCCALPPHRLDGTWDSTCAAEAFNNCAVCDVTAIGPLNLTADEDGADDIAPQVSTDGAGNWVAVWHSFEDGLPKGLGMACDSDNDCVIEGENCAGGFCTLDLGSDADIFTSHFRLDSMDCNANDRSDACDIAGGSSADCNDNDVPDECESLESTIDDQPDSAVACDGDEVTFTVLASGGFGPITYQWRKNGSPIGGATSSSLVIAAVTPGDAGDYDVVVGNDCASVISSVAVLTVHANPEPVITADPGSTVCSGTTVTLDAGPGYVTYFWTPGNQTSQTIDVTQNGVYSVTVIDANGCVGTDQLALTVTPCGGGLVCDPSDGQCKECVSGDDCEDGDPCTDNNCVDGSCSFPFSALSTPCEADGDLCTIDHCDGSGTCVTFDNVSCQPSNPPCEGGEECNPVTGTCEAQPDGPISTECDADADGCTLDHCDGAGGCVFVDNLVCDPDTTCFDGTCVPNNDTCSGAVSVAVGSTTPGTTTDASTDQAAPSPCGSFVTSPGVWYSTTGTGNTMTASTCGPVFEFDTKISIYRGTCGALECVFGNNDDCAAGASSTLSTAEWCSEVGVQYYILVHGLAGGTGLFELTVADGAACTTCKGDGDCGVDEFCQSGTCVPAPVCGVMGSGDCLDLNGTGSPGCEDPVCCLTICTDPVLEFCCEVEWTESCAIEATLTCNNPVTPCLPTDLNMDGTTNAADLAALLGAWGVNPGHAADFNGDDLVNAADLAQMLGSWGDVCDDDDPCTVDSCDDMTGDCVFTPLDCPPGEVCVDGVCVPQ